MTSPVLAGHYVVREPGPDPRTGKWSASFAVAITGDEPVFAGHYPHFPIFPGVCVLECVRDAARSAMPPGAGELRLAVVESARFLSSVHPGDVLEIELTWVPYGDDWRCDAKAATARGRAATVRCRYRREETS
ncbi:3-hydroxyacyl-ACP dehydratase FabZ family protein [Streptomyces sp. NPDC079020]|uniref:3-hydroxyacyl-ACP dehydratase FabZ family protein n=1 Tax=Streptomyces sp. NPDC079020 TaxID=3365722 RepID=UPI0037D0F50B